MTDPVDCSSGSGAAIHQISAVVTSECAGISWLAVRQVVEQCASLRIG